MTTLDSIVFGGTPDENAELAKLVQDVKASPDDFEPWEALLRAAESQEGGLGKHSNPQAVESTRKTYDALLNKFPLFFGYWKKYADLEFSLAETEAAEMIYERGIASVPNSVDLWTNYCGFKVQTCHIEDLIRKLFERGALCVGLDFLAHPFWDKYLEFEERAEAPQNIFAILERVIHIPMHQYARYFERYRQLAQSRPIAELASEDIITQFQSEVQSDPAFAGRSELEIERELRARLDKFHMEIFHRTATMTSRRWTYEQEIKRPYFHVTELDEPQLENWRKYLDFEEQEGDYHRIRFLYERCLVSCAYYDEFWARYTRWMISQGKDEEVHWIFMRGCCQYVPISRPGIRHLFALFEESRGNTEMARAIYESVLMVCGNHLDTIRALAELTRRHEGVESALQLLSNFRENNKQDVYLGGWVAVEMANLEWKIRGDTEAARRIYETEYQKYPDSRPLFINWFFFEVNQPHDPPNERFRHLQLKKVIGIVRKEARISPLVIRDLTNEYLTYLRTMGPSNAAQELVELDVQNNGPFMVRDTHKARLDPEGDVAAVNRRIASENGHPGVAVNEAAVRRGENPYSKYFQEQQQYEPGGNGGIAG